MGSTVSVLKCPQCAACVTPTSRFARQTTCPYCSTTLQLDPSVVSAARFREAHRRWSAPEALGLTDWISIGDSCWTVGDFVARGEASEVFVADRARWPSERVLLKVLKDPAGAAHFDNEWNALEALDRGVFDGVGSPRIPEPVVRGVIAGGPLDGRRAMALRWVTGYLHTFDDVRGAFPAGVDPRVAVWMWRRILEVLAVLHREGLVHGAVLPTHLLVQRNDHGVRLVGYGRAGRPGSPLSLAEDCRAFYPPEALAHRVLTEWTDIQMSARCLAWVLGGNPATGVVPSAVPAPLADLIARVATQRPGCGPAHDAWAIRNQIGVISQALFGAPSFNPLVMPDEHRR